MTDDGLLIYHIFADDGVESEPLSGYGRVIRLGLDPRDSPFSEVVQADARTCPLTPGADLAVLHPPCHEWSNATPATPENLIPHARDLGETLADEYIIENQPGAPLRCPDGGSLLTLTGDMFGLPVEYERIFECSYAVSQPSRRAIEPVHRVENTRPKQYWKTVKGVIGDYRNQPLALSGTPAAYIHHLVRPLIPGYEHNRDPAQTTLATGDGQ